MKGGKNVETWQIIATSVVANILSGRYNAGVWEYLHMVYLEDLLSPPSAPWSSRPPNLLLSGFYLSVGWDKWEGHTELPRCCADSQLSARVLTRLRQPGHHTMSLIHVAPHTSVMLCPPQEASGHKYISNTDEAASRAEAGKSSLQTHNNKTWQAGGWLNKDVKRPKLSPIEAKGWLRF